ncbi:hypothetical protein BDK51DRAFT_45603 [Blyttiomyces helicus]|uniref:Uncharacterized protein n=1 Tax=Blyttiomyces helicus TaxID=388810 RepID=A0A4P9W334_9FUNG|nr:hypothetical protein BDK51DRAFT_45603 [Blyttiomyces helicus]|eukprot:RKO85613.1 hypothetical protein BDK51DRAFT_45603 [Blyttiomyces helicus]
MAIGSLLDSEFCRLHHAVAILLRRNVRPLDADFHHHRLRGMGASRSIAKLLRTLSPSSTVQIAPAMSARARSAALPGTLTLCRGIVLTVREGSDGLIAKRSRAGDGGRGPRLLPTCSFTCSDGSGRSAGSTASMPKPPSTPARSSAGRGGSLAPENSGGASKWARQWAALSPRWVSVSSGSCVRVLQIQCTRSQTTMLETLFPFAVALVPTLECKAANEGIRRLRRLDFFASWGGGRTINVNAAINPATGPRLSSWTGVWTDHARNVAANSTNLKCLHRGLLHAPETATIAARCRHLLSVDHSGDKDTRPNDNAVQALLRNCPAIEELALFKTAVTIVTINALKADRPLKILTLGGEQGPRLSASNNTATALGELLSTRGASLTRLRIGERDWRMDAKLQSMLLDVVLRLQNIHRQTLPRIHRITCLPSAGAARPRGRQYGQDRQIERFCPLSRFAPQDGVPGLRRVQSFVLRGRELGLSRWDHTSMKQLVNTLQMITEAAGGRVTDITGFSGIIL